MLIYNDVYIYINMIKHVRNLPHNPTDGLDITGEPRQVDAHCGIVVGLLWERFGLYLQLG